MLLLFLPRSVFRIPSSDASTGTAWISKAAKKNTLLFRSEGLHVGIVKDGKVELSTVTPGHDFGDQIEIVSGLKANDQVIINPPDSIVSGQQVQIVQATLPGDTK